ncbi:unnamed protein product, partial [Brassica rapa subsp. trilocularis]
QNSRGYASSITEVGLDVSEEEEPLLLELALEWIPRQVCLEGVDTLNCLYFIHSIGMLPGIPGHRWLPHL